MNIIQRQARDITEYDTKLNRLSGILQTNVLNVEEVVIIYCRQNPMITWREIIDILTRRALKGNSLEDLVNATDKE